MSAQDSDPVGNAIERVFSLYKDYGNADYIGEPVSMLEHSLQAANCAQVAQSTGEEILGALLHDIGHVIGIRAITLSEDSSYKQMDGCGVMDHENIGAEFLKQAGFSEGVVQICRGHVSAKRYLCYKNPTYMAKLSDASKTTLRFQGGPMTQKEAEEFEANPYHLGILRMRSFDEAAKIPGKSVPDLDSYRELMRSNICSNLNYYKPP